MGLRGNELFFKDSLDRQALYQSLLKAYKSTYQTQFDSLLQCDTLEEFLKGYDAIDYDCLKPCEDSGLFKGLKRYAVGLTGRLVELVENANYFLRHQPPRSLYVVSQSWYNEMVVNCLCDNVWQGPFTVFPSHVFSSSLEYDAQGVATGKLVKLCGGCEHKKAVMNGIASRGLRVMIGDSLGDLSCLLEADVGIIMNPSESFKRVCARYHIELRDLMLCGAREKNVLYTCRDWSEICAVLCWSRMMCDPWTEEENVEPDRCSEECRLMALTNEHLNQVGGLEMEEAICEAIAGGATMIQIRDKTEDFGRLASLSQPQTAWWRTPTS